jgi:hypothetical protein
VSALYNLLMYSLVFGVMAVMFGTLFGIALWLLKAAWRIVMWLLPGPSDRMTTRSDLQDAGQLAVTEFSVLSGAWKRATAQLSRSTTTHPARATVRARSVQFTRSHVFGSSTTPPSSSFLARETERALAPPHAALRRPRELRPAGSGAISNGHSLRSRARSPSTPIARPSHDPRRHLHAAA